MLSVGHGADPRQFRPLIVSSDSSSSVPTLHRQLRLLIVSSRLLIVSSRLFIVSPDSSSSVPDSSSPVPTPHRQFPTLHRQFRLFIVSPDSSSSVPTLFNPDIEHVENRLDGGVHPLERHPLLLAVEVHAAVEQVRRGDAHEGQARAIRAPADR